jgi:diacylglycerol kinase
MAILLVIGFEIMNTAMEKFLDIVHPDSHYQIRYIKDSMAGAVLVSAVIAFVVGVIVFYPYVAAMFA